MKKQLLVLFAMFLMIICVQFYSCKKRDDINIGINENWVAVDQGLLWTNADRNSFYIQDQGVRTIPYSWFTSLQDVTGKPFLSDNLQRFGFIPIQGRKLPVGFALGRDTSNLLTAGFTCASCHTREIIVDNISYRIDGAPSLANFEHYYKDLQIAMTATVNDQVKLEQFLDKIIATSSSNGDPAITDRNQLSSQVIKWQKDFSQFYQLCLPSSDMWGVGRLDALGQIINRVTAVDISPNPDRMILGNISPANRPVRPPFLWNVKFQDYTQWGGTSVNGNSSQALLRNLGEALGVGTQLRPVPNTSSSNGFDFLIKNTSNFSGLLALENNINKIGPPKWPWSLDNNLVNQGAILFAANCASCHGTTPGEARLPSITTWATPIQDVGTDPTYWDNVVRTGNPGIYSSSFPAVTSLINLVSYTEREILNQYQPGITLIQPTNSTGPGKYESRVLKGIWAAAPYLHNGSVPTLDDLLKPAIQRPTTFSVGVNYDTLNVGMSIVQPLRQGSQFNTSITGNSNKGHEYGIQLSPQQRAALLEYLKTL